MLPPATTMVLVVQSKVTPLPVSVLAEVYSFFSHMLQTVIQNAMILARTKRLSPWSRRPALVIHNWAVVIRETSLAIRKSDCRQKQLRHDFYISPHRAEC